jgi:hypothetical protein
LLQTKMKLGHQFFLVMIVLIALTLYILNFNFAQVGIFSDDAAYIILAQSIATGQGYGRINFPIPAPEVAWPIGYPLLLSPLVAVWPFSYWPLKILSTVLIVASIFILWKYLNYRIAATYSLLVVALFAMNNHVVNYASFVMSDAPYLFWSLLALLLYQKFENENYARWYHVPVLALIITAAALTRLIGVSLALAFGVILLLRFRFKLALVFGAIFLIGFSPQFLLARIAGGSLFPPEVAETVDVTTNYLKFFPNLNEYFFVHIPMYMSGLFGPMTMNYAEKLGVTWFVLLVKYILVFLVFLGLLRLLRKKIHMDEIYLIGYFSVLGIKTWEEGADTTPRYLLPLLPLLYLYLIYGTDWVATALANRFSRRAIVPAVISLVFVPMLVLLCIRGLRSASTTYAATDLTAGATWIAANAEADSVVMTPLPLHHYLYARRHTVYSSSNLAPDQEALFNAIKDQNVSYVLVSPGMQHTENPTLNEYQSNIVLPTLVEYPDYFEQVYHDVTKNVWVYRVIKTWDERAHEPAGN